MQFSLRPHLTAMLICRFGLGGKLRDWRIPSLGGRLPALASPDTSEPYNDTMARLSALESNIPGAEAHNRGRDQLISTGLAGQPFFLLGLRAE